MTFNECDAVELIWDWKGQACNRSVLKSRILC